MQHSRHRESNYSKHIRHHDSIIRIHILRSDSMDACTRGGLYCSAEPLPMGFTLPRTRLTFKHLRPLSCQRLKPPATLTTWVSLLYMRLTDPLEFRDAILTWIHTLIYTLHATMKFPHETHGITPITYNFHVSHTTTTTFILYIQFSFHPTIIYNSIPSLIPNIPIPGHIYFRNSCIFKSYSQPFLA